MISSANQMTVSMWDTTLDQNELNKSEHLWLILFGLNLFRALKSSGLGESIQKSYVGVREMKRGKRV